MTEIVDGRDVLDADATIRVPLRGRVVARFRRCGPNTWDPYERVEVVDGPELEVFAETPIELEASGARFRMRRHGEVIVVEWRATESAARPRAADAEREAFLRAHVRGEDPTPEGNAGLWLYREVHRERDPHD
jgi:hypothetical protein